MRKPRTKVSKLEKKRRIVFSRQKQTGSSEVSTAACNNRIVTQVGNLFHSNE